MHIPSSDGFGCGFGLRKALRGKGGKAREPGAKMSLILSSREEADVALLEKVDAAGRPHLLPHRRGDAHCAEQCRTRPAPQWAMQGPGPGPRGSPSQLAAERRLGRT